VVGVGDGLHFPTPAFLVICYVSRVLELSRDQRLAFHCHYASQWTLHHRENTRLAQEVDDIKGLGEQRYWRSCRGEARREEAGATLRGVPDAGGVGHGLWAGRLELVDGREEEWVVSGRSNSRLVQ